MTRSRHWPIDTKPLPSPAAHGLEAIRVVAAQGTAQGTQYGSARDRSYLPTSLQRPKWQPRTAQRAVQQTQNRQGGRWARTSHTPAARHLLPPGIREHGEPVSANESRKPCMDWSPVDGLGTRLLAAKWGVYGTRRCGWCATGVVRGKNDFSGRAGTGTRVTGGGEGRHLLCRIPPSCMIQRSVPEQIRSRNTRG